MPVHRKARVSSGDLFVGGTNNSVVYLDGSGAMVADGVLSVYGDVADPGALVQIEANDLSNATTGFELLYGDDDPGTLDEFVAFNVSVITGAITPAEDGFVGYSYTLESGGLTGTNEPFMPSFSTTVTGHADDDADIQYNAMLASCDRNGGSSDNAAFVFAGDWDVTMLDVSNGINIVTINAFGNTNGDDVSLQASDAAGGGGGDGGSLQFLAGNADGAGTGGALSLIAQDASGGVVQAQVGASVIWRTFSSGIFAVVDNTHFGTGHTTEVAQVSAADTVTLGVGTEDQVQRYDFAAGSGGYTYNIDLQKGPAVEGSHFKIHIVKAASANPTIKIRNGDAGADLISLNNGNAEDWYFEFNYDGTDWKKEIGCLNDL